MSSGPRIALAVLLVAAAGPAGFLAYRLLHTATRTTGIGPAGISGVDAPPTRRTSSAPSAAASKPIPEVLPDLTLPDAQGIPRKLSAWRGRPLLINFWATWCEPCRREIPLLKSLRHSATDHLEVIGVAVDDRDPVMKYAREMGIDYPVLIGGTDGGLAAIDAFGMQAVLPFSVFADTHGRIVAVKVGELHPDDARLILGRLAEVDAGRLALQSARDEISSGLAALAAARARG